MNTPLRRVVLAATILVGIDVGAWAALAPRSFYDDFPGLGLHWIREYGPYDGHLVSDTGSAYLAFTAVSVAGLVARSAGPGRAAGLVWTVFGALHLAFHAAHPMGSTGDVVGTLASLAVSLLLGIALLVLPVRAAAAVAR